VEARRGKKADKNVRMTASDSVYYGEKLMKRGKKVGGRVGQPRGRVGKGSRKFNRGSIARGTE